MLKVADVIAKARLSGAYCASDQFFAELAPLKEGLYPKDLLEIFDIWQKWRASFYLDVSERDTNSLFECEEVARCQKVRAERYYLECYFKAGFGMLVRPLEEEFYAYVESMLDEPIENIRSLDLLDGVLQYMCAHRSFQKEEAEKHLLMLRNCFAGLKSSLGI